MKQFLRPLAEILLRQGVTAHEFKRWADWAFVRAAAEILREQGQEPRFSRISAITGIHRHAVSDILGGTEGRPAGPVQEKEYQRHRLARVLSGWFEDPDFTDEAGRPLVLPVSGPAPSFEELVRGYSGDIYFGIILDELVRVGAVRKVADGKVEARSRRYTTGGADEVAIKHADIVTADVLRTLEHNTRAAPDGRFYEDAAIALHIPADTIPRLARLLERRATTFLDDMDGWLSGIPTVDDEPGGSQTSSVRAGVRVLMVVDKETPRDEPAPATSDNGTDEDGQPD